MNNKNDATIARMLTTVADFELKRTQRKAEQYRENRTLELEFSLRDIKRQYDGASTAISVALKQANNRLKRHDEQYERLQREHNKTKDSTIRNLSQLKQELMTEVQDLHTKQLTMFEHMRYNHRKALENVYQVEKNPNQHFQREDINSRTFSHSHSPLDTHQSRNFQSIQKKSSEVHGIRSPESQFSNSQLFSSIHRKNSIDERYGTQKIPQEEEKITKKWKNRIAEFGLERKRTLAKRSKNVSSHYSSDTEESIAEPAEAILAKLQARVRKARQKKTILSQESEFQTHDSAQPSTDDYVSSSAGPDFDSFLYSQNNIKTQDNTKSKIDQEKKSTKASNKCLQSKSTPEKKALT